MSGDTPAAAPGGAAAAASPALPATAFVVHYAGCGMLPEVVAVSTSWEDATAAADAEVASRGRGHCPGAWSAPVGPARARSRAVVTGTFNDLLVLQEIAVECEAGASPPTRIHLVTYEPGLHPGLPFAAAFTAEAARAAADREVAARGGTYVSDWTAVAGCEVRDATHGPLWDRIVVTTFPFRGPGAHAGSAGDGS
ncbi:MAG: hypothetical protein AB1941_05055 [Gemmatimonadota bacterium]